MVGIRGLVSRLTAITLRAPKAPLSIRGVPGMGTQGGGWVGEGGGIPGGTPVPGGCSPGVIRGISLGIPRRILQAVPRGTLQTKLDRSVLSRCEFWYPRSDPPDQTPTASPPPLITIRPINKKSAPIHTGSQMHHHLAAPWGC